MPPQSPFTALFNSLADSPAHPTHVEHFTYRNLQPDQIRLFSIGNGAEINGRLYHNLSLTQYFRDEAPEYVALSYEWGGDDDAADLKMILINDKPFHVRRNLWSCLHYLTFDPHHHIRHRFVWADAICVNQQDTDERNEQVMRMDRTYSGTHEVLIWLRPWLELGLDNEELVAHTQRHWGYYLPAHPYWTRRWVIQEVLLARIKVVFLGYNLLYWHTIHLYGILVRLGLPRSFSWTTRRLRASGRLGKSRLGGYAPFYQHERLFRSNPHPYPFARLLDLYQDSQCRDPRDAVFALLSLLKDDERSALSYVFPDYSLSAEKVQLLALCYLNIRHGLLKHTNGFRISLGSCGVIPPYAIGVESVDKLHEMMTRAQTLTAEELAAVNQPQQTRSPPFRLKSLALRSSDDRKEQEALLRKREREYWQAIGDTLRKISAMI